MQVIRALDVLTVGNAGYVPSKSLLFLGRDIWVIDIAPLDAKAWVSQEALALHQQQQWQHSGSDGAVPIWKLWPQSPWKTGIAQRMQCRDACSWTSALTDRSLPHTWFCQDQLTRWQTQVPMWLFRRLMNSTMPPALGASSLLSTSSKYSCSSSGDWNVEQSGTS